MVWQRGVWWGWGLKGGGGGWVIEQGGGGVLVEKCNIKQQGPRIPKKSNIINKTCEQFDLS